MIRDDVAVREYLLAPEDSFWEWSEGGELIVWRSGPTIAFRAEMQALVEHLGPRGLPRFGALVLLVAATREAWTSSGDEVRLLGHLLGPSESSHELQRAEHVVQGLERVRALDAALRTSIDAKRALAELVFDGCPAAFNEAQAADIAAALRAGLGDTLADVDLNVSLTGYARVLLLRDLAALGPGLERVTPEAIRLRAATGLVELPRAASLDLPPAQAARSLISSLADGDDELQGLGRVARRLLTSAGLPRRLSAPPEQELGGYADIANRGALDRLLVSELAHDDFTLSVRVAMNEALYLRRESPPSRPLQHRAILIDAGIRTWGVPRVFAAAAALAFAATLSGRGSIRFARGQGDQFAEVDLLTREGLVAHLASLEPHLSLADALPSFLREVVAGDADVEVILVMSEDGLADPAVQDALRRSGAPQLFLATVQRDGRFRLLERRPHGVKLRHEATLDLGELLVEQPRLIDRAAGEDLPAIFAADPFPLLLPHGMNAEQTWFAGAWGVLSITGDHRLMQWTARERGAQQLTDRLPRGKLWWASATDDNDSISLVLGSAEKLQHVRVDRAGELAAGVRLQCDAVRGVCAHQGKLFAIAKRMIYVVDPETGLVIQRLQPPADAHWQRDRFFQTRDGVWLALSHDGQTARFDAVFPPGGESGSRELLAVFDRAGVEGALGVNRFGFLYTGTGPAQRIPHELVGELSVPWIARDGQRLQLRSPSMGPSAWPLLIDVASKQILRPGGLGIDDRVEQIVSQRTLRRRFSGVGLTDRGDLGLRSRRGQILCCKLVQGSPVFMIEERGRQLDQEQAFEPLKTRYGYQLTAAAWDDGSRCVLDARGLVHLRAARRETPEATLVLAEGELSGWSPAHGVWGNPYFAPPGAPLRTTPADKREAFAATVQAFAEGLRG